MEQAADLAQIVLAVSAIVAGVVAYGQFKAYRLFEMLKYIEAPEARSSRRKVFDARDAVTKKVTGGQHDQGLNEAASNVCASYDTLGLMSKRDRVLRGFFVEEWASSIRWSYEALEDFVNDQRQTNNPEAYHGFKWLYERIK